MTYADCEPLVPDAELRRITGTVRALVTLPQDTQMDARRVPVEGMEGEVHLLVQSLHPRKLQREAGAIHTTIARLLQSTWDAYATQRAWYVDKREDKLLKAFLLLANRHYDELEQLRNTIN